MNNWKVAEEQFLFIWFKSPFLILLKINNIIYIES